MNYIYIIDLISVVSFITAFIITIRSAGNKLDTTSRLLLLVCTGLYILLGISNFLEHSGITKFFDYYEDYLEIMFLPFFLFFLYSRMVNIELEKRMRAEKVLKESEESYRTLVENINLGITLIDINHNILMINSTHGKYFERKPPDFIGKKCYREFEKRDHVCPDCPGIESMKTGKAFMIDKFGTKDDGEKFPVKIRTFPVFDGNNSILGFIEVVEDMTDFKIIEEELLKKKKLDSVGILAGGIAHDFNNLLTAIMGNISLAKINLNPDEDIYSKLTEIENASCRAKDLTQQLLTFSKGGAPIKKTTTVVDLIVDSTNFILHGTNIITRFNIQKNLWHIDADEGQLSQVIYNLVANSRDAMPDGGVISVSAENINGPPAELSVLQEGRYIRITITDTGIGIEPEDISKIFDPFFTTKDEGSGLGLSTAYSIIKKHEGVITAKSVPGSGTCFSIYLPVSKNKLIAADKINNEIIRGSGRIIIMDDEKIVRDIAAKMLKQLGYDVVEASEGCEVIALYRESLLNGSPVDLVILDLTVPGGMGGLKTINELKKINPDIRAVVSSGYSSDPVMSEYRKYGFCGIAPKPYKIQDIGMLLKEIIDGIGKN